MADGVQRTTSVLSDSDIKPVGIPTMKKLACPLADTEYSYVIPNGTRKILVYLMGAAVTDVLKYYWAPGSADYGELYGAESLTEDNILMNGKTIYFKVSVSAKSVHISTWQ